MTKSDNGEDGMPFNPLGEYEWPGMPAESFARSMVNRAKELLRISEDEPEVGAERLNRTSKARRNDLSAPPACSPLLKEVDKAVDSWMNERDEESSVYLLVLPPCQQKSLLRLWAESHDHEMLCPPNREELLEAAGEAVDLQGEGVLVIPDLADWFLRHRNALSQVKSLLATLYTTQRTCIVGCNSWAWQFFCRAIDAEHYLPPPFMFTAFDSQRLREWFASMAKDSDTSDVRFRESTTGDGILKLDSDGELQSTYLRTLASYSLGIPWVAWHIWRRSLRTVPEGEGAEQSGTASDDVDTMWLVEHYEYTLAEEDRDIALLILHALLLHGTLTQSQLALVVPIVSVSAQVQALLVQEFIDEANGKLSCTSAAYPATRKYIVNSGITADTL